MIPLSTKITNWKGEENGKTSNNLLLRHDAWWCDGR